jgi:hypothetical protein
MKRRAMLFNVAVVSLLVCSAYGRTGDDRVKSVDVDKVRAHRATRFIEKVFWPSATLISQKKISKGLVPQDVEQFKDMLQIVLRPEYAVTLKDIDANAVAVEEPRPRDANDYILLEYTRNKRQIKIQDGKALWISVFPDPNTPASRVDIARYVKATAFEILNIPKSDEEGKEPNLYVATLDIGASDWGNMVYGASYPAPKFWYSHIAWWSDGRNVMFMMGKKRFDKDEAPVEDRTSAVARARAKARMEAGPSPNSLKPRKFRKQTSTGSPGNAQADGRP